MSGRWGGDIKGRRRTGSRKRRDWQPPKATPSPRMEPRLRAATMLTGVGFYLLTLAGAILTLGA